MSTKKLEDYKHLINFEDLRKYFGVQDYEKEHVNILKFRENCRLHFKFQSGQLEYRSAVVELIKQVGEIKKLQSTTVHLAVYILDQFMDNYDIIVEKLNLTALVALLLASKFEEQGTNILKLTQLNELIERKYKIREYHTMEILMLKQVKWYLNYPTVVHFIYVYMEHILSPEDPDFENLYHRDLLNDILHTLNYYLDLVLDDIMLMQTRPSLVASAIIALTRSNIGFVKMWPPRLVSVTGYEIHELRAIIASFNRLIARK